MLTLRHRFQLHNGCGVPATCVDGLLACCLF